MEWHSKWYVTHNGITLKIKCCLKCNVTLKKILKNTYHLKRVSPKIEYHSKWNVTQNGMTKWNVTQNEM